MTILDISDSLKIIQKHKKAEKSEVISDRQKDRQTDRQTDTVNYRVALTRLKIMCSGLALSESVARLTGLWIE